MAIAPAKVILAGEHFCVYGTPAVVMAIDLRARLTARASRNGILISSPKIGVAGRYQNYKFFPKKGGAAARAILDPVRLAAEAVLRDLARKKRNIKLEIKSEIPVSVGLGSSAAVAVATTSAVARLMGNEISKEKICELAYASEKFVHGRPSGIDQTASTFGGLLLYRQNKGFHPLRSGESLSLIVGNTGILRSTGDIVSKVRKLIETKKSRMQKIIEAGGKVASRLGEALSDGDLKRVGDLMNENHSLLRKIGVSHDRLDVFVDRARKAGALGAKLTGGGNGGCMIALVDNGSRKRVSDAIRQLGGDAYAVSVDKRGVQSWAES